MNVKTFEEVRQRFLEITFRRTIRFDCCCCEWRYYSGSDAESAFESGYAVAEIAFKGCRSKQLYDRPRLLEEIRFEVKGKKKLLVEDRVKPEQPLNYARQLLLGAGLL